MKRIVLLLVLVSLATTLYAVPTPKPTQMYEFRTVIGMPCGGDLPTDLCSAAGDAIALTKAVLGNYSTQGWQVVSTTPVAYAAGNEAVAFLLRRNATPPAVPPKAKQFQIVMGMPCGQMPSGLYSRLCTAGGATIEDTLNGNSGDGWQVVNTTSCAYKYDQTTVGMSVYVLAK